MLILDTNTLSDLLKNHSKVRTRLEAVPDDRLVVISIISRIEILEGRFASITKAASRAELLLAASRLIRDESYLNSIETLGVTDPVANQFEKLRSDKRLKKMGRKDLLIACFALAHGATLVTRNTRDFVLIPHLKIENWTD